MENSNGEELTVFKIWSEWDLGIPELYNSKALAWEYIESALEDFVDYTVDEAVSQGLVSVTEVKVICE